jgi:tetratricopeptide (TPR) repeat protein
MGLAYAYSEKKDHANAYEMYTRLFQDNVKGSPGFITKAYYQLGYAAWKLGKKDEAYRSLAMAEPGMRKDKFLLADLAGLYTSMMDMNKAYELYSELYPMLEQGDAKDKLSMLLRALEKRIKKPQG